MNAEAGNDFYDGAFGDDSDDDASVDIVSYAMSTGGVVIDLSAGTEEEIQLGIVSTTNDGYGDADRIRHVEQIFLSGHDDLFIYADNRFDGYLTRLKVFGGASTGLGDVADFSQISGGVEAMSGQIIALLCRNHHQAKAAAHAAAFATCELKP